MKTNRSGFSRCGFLRDVPTRDTLRDIAEDFVWCAVREFRVLECVDAETCAIAQQNNFVSYGHPGDAGDIDESQIHRDLADDWRIVLAENDASAVGKLTVVSVGVAHREHGNVRASFGHVSGVVAEGMVCSKIAQRQDA